MTSQVNEVLESISAPAGPDAHKPHAETYVVLINEESYRVSSPQLYGRELLVLAGERPCRYRLIQLQRGHMEAVILPEEPVDLTLPGAERFRTEVKELVTIYINHDGRNLTVDLRPGEYTALQIKDEAGIPDGYMLFSKQTGPPLPLPDERKIEIEGCEAFLTQVSGGGAS
jgi:hypothetical protein